MRANVMSSLKHLMPRGQGFPTGEVISYWSFLPNEQLLMEILNHHSISTFSVDKMKAV